MTAYMCTEEQFTGWVTAAPAGSVLEYHRGSLPVDCRDDRHITRDPAVAALRRVRRVVRDACETGLVELTQKRHADLDYSYFATRRNKHA